jgi:hypothetical protein
LNTITWQPALQNNGMGLQYRGKLQVPQSVPYTFTLVSLGGSRLVIDGKEVLRHFGKHDHDGRMSRDIKGVGTVELAVGEHDFLLEYYKNTWAPTPILGLFVEGKGNYPQALHAASSYPDEEAVSRSFIQPVGEPYMLRSFINFKGKRKTYCIAVGEPAGIHYAYDLSSGALMKAWRGPFVDATPMWHERGNQVIELPSGGLSFDDQPQWAQLTNAQSPWPDSLPAGQYVLQGYNLDKAGRPEYQYRMGAILVNDFLEPSPDNLTIRRRLRFTGAPAGTYYRLAAGALIEPMPDGSYAINDRAYFVRVEKNTRPLVRNSNNQYELLLPVGQQDGEFTYSIIW